MDGILDSVHHITPARYGSTLENAQHSESDVVKAWCWNINVLLKGAREASWTTAYAATELSGSVWAFFKSTRSIVGACTVIRFLKQDHSRNSKEEEHEEKENDQGHQQRHSLKEADDYSS